MLVLVLPSAVLHCGHVVCLVYVYVCMCVCAYGGDKRPSAIVHHVAFLRGTLP